MGSQKHLQRESRSWKLDRPWRHLAGVSGAFPHVHVKSSCRASDSSLMYPHVPTTPHVCTTPMPSARWVTCCWGGGQELWDVFFVGERWFFSSNQERVRTSWCHERSKSSLLFLLFFFWLSIRLSKFSAIAVLVKPLGFSGIRRWAVEDIFATLLEVLIRSKKSRVLQPCLSQSGLGPGLSGQAWLFHTWDSWPPGCD